MMNAQVRALPSSGISDADAVFGYPGVVISVRTGAGVVVRDAESETYIADIYLRSPIVCAVVSLIQG
jgi:hypothetical protein